MQRLKEYSYTKEEKALRKRLAGFTAVYKQACQTFLDTAGEKYPEATYDRDVPNSLTISAAILALVSDEWSDIKVRADTIYRYHEPWWQEYCVQCFNPLRFETVDTFRDWWKATYETSLDYSYPPAPDPLPTEIKKVNQRTYRIGQFELRFVNEQRFRKIEVWIACGQIDEWYEDVNLKTLPETIKTVFAPRMLPLLALCDWDQFESFTSKQKEALARKYHPLKRAWKEQAS